MKENDTLLVENARKSVGINILNPNWQSTQEMFGSRIYIPNLLFYSRKFPALLSLKTMLCSAKEIQAQSYKLLLMVLINNVESSL